MKARGSLTSAELIARCEPIRLVRRPFECRGDQPGFAGPCWVKEPYEAITTERKTPRCGGCGGVIDPNRIGAPSPAELISTGVAA